MTELNRVLVLLGSNDNAAENIENAISQLKTMFAGDCCVSDVFVSKAVHSNGTLSGKPDYLNALCWGRTSLSADALNARLKKLEDFSGRKRGPEAMGLVTLDLDILFWNGQNIREADCRQHYFLTCMNNLRCKFPHMDWSKQAPGVS